ncbi:DUF7710 domain-containing protein [Archangium lansingense]|uniref:DUF7710 domain-containing protein n=1 Tax=Archangium lansingense TaxID=2995310 RepID=UPI003B76FBA1
MRRLTFPTVMPYGECEAVVWFPATRDVLSSLGEPVYIEEDSMRTAGGREWFWAYETEDGLRLLLVWAEPYGAVSVVADPPEPQRAIAALRELGIEAPFEKSQLPEGFAPLKRGYAQGAVWLFTGEGAAQPTAVFSRKQLADDWLARTRFTGTLVPYPIDRSRYEFERIWGQVPLPPPGSTEAQQYVGTVGERYEYFEGRLLSGKERWQLWRQDDNGARFRVQDFASRAEAVKALQKMESAVHKQGYWLELQEGAK